MHRDHSNYTERWVAIPLRYTELSGTVEFLEHGAVRLGERVFAPGRAIDHAFAGYTATRTSDVAAPLKIKARQGGASCFRYSGTDWFKLVLEEASPVEPLFPSLRVEIAASGLVIGPIYWSIVVFRRFVLLPLVLLLPYVVIACFFFSSFRDNHDHAVAIFERTFCIGAFVLLSAFYVSQLRHWQVTRRSGR